jgi:hypothetical protein
VAPQTQCLSPQNSSAPLAEDIDPEVSSGLGCCPPCSSARPHQCRLIPSFIAWQLARYLNRNYWEKKQEEARKSPTPSAPVPLTEPAAQPGEGHTAPNSMAEVRGSFALLTVVPRARSNVGQRPSNPLISSRLLFQRQTLSP